MSDRKLASTSLFLLLLAAASVTYSVAVTILREALTTNAGVLGNLPRGVERSALNVVVITLDTFRADRLGAYGSTRGLTPHLDRLGREGVVFEATQSVAPLTLPAHCSLFTGRFPPAHGVHENAGVLGAAHGPATLAELLSRRGFQTGAFVASGVLDASRGLNRGFARYDAPVPSGRPSEGPPRRPSATDPKVRPTASSRTPAQSHWSAAGTSLQARHGPAPERLRARRQAHEIVDHAVEWIDLVADSRFFAWLHFYDAHAPYASPEPFSSAHAGQPYDGAIAFIDAQIGRFLDTLERRGLLDRTLVVVIADHGEGLGDHGEWTHGLFLYESVLHVPFLIRAPFSALRGRRVSQPTRSVDMMPTIFELLDIGRDRPLDGRSLVPLIAGARLELEAYAENLYPQLRFGWSAVRALRSGPFKVIATARPELYDLAHDPGERRNLFDERRGLAEQMLARLERYTSTSAVTADPKDHPLDSDLRARLAALGYVTAPASVTRLSAGDDHREPGSARDPKDVVALFNRLTWPPGGPGPQSAVETTLVPTGGRP